MGHSLLAATPGAHSSAHPGAGVWGGDASPTATPALDSAALAWPWPGGVVSTLEFDPQNEGDKAYTAIAVIRGGDGSAPAAIVDRVACLGCGTSHVRVSPVTAFADASVHLEAFQVWAGEFADAHDRAACSPPYGEPEPDAAGALRDVVTEALGAGDATEDFLDAFARSSLDAGQGEWTVLIGTRRGVRLVDAGTAGLASNVTLDGSPLTRDHDVDLRAVAARLGSTIACDGRGARAVLAVSGDAYDLGVGVRRWTVLTATRTFVCETGPTGDPDAPLGVALGLDALTKEGVTRYFSPDRIRVAMMLADGFDRVDASPAAR